MLVLPHIASRRPPGIWNDLWRQIISAHKFCIATLTQKATSDTSSSQSCCFPFWKLRLQRSIPTWELWLYEIPHSLLLYLLIHTPADNPRLATQWWSPPPWTSTSQMTSNILASYHPTIPDCVTCSPTTRSPNCQHPLCIGTATYLWRRKIPYHLHILQSRGCQYRRRNVSFSGLDETYYEPDLCSAWERRCSSTIPGDCEGCEG